MINRYELTSVRKSWIAISAAVALCMSAAWGAVQSPPASENREWIREMKEAERGPFLRIRWFCEDGSVLAPKAYACKDRGGGVQHGEWNDRTRALREQGYAIANVLAGIDTDDFVASPDLQDLFAMLLIERFLIAFDDGWIFRRAQFYRGAFQEEDERAAGRDLLSALSAKEEWIGRRYPMLRIGARYVPHGKDTASAQHVRQESAALSDRDKAFAEIRAKIHAAPEASDAVRVREYASSVNDTDLAARYEALAAEIESIYNPEPLGDILESNAKVFGAGPWLQEILRSARRDFEANSSPINRFTVTANLLVDLREAIARVNSPGARLRVLDISLAVEQEHFRAASELTEALQGASRAEHVRALRSAAQAAYGVGLVNPRLHAAAEEAFASLERGDLNLRTYMSELRYLGLIPGWGSQGLHLYFGDAMAKLSEIEPLANLFIQDQLRGSPLLFYSRLLDGLVRDANALAGVEHQVFGDRVGVGFNALNPGLARGRLYTKPNMENVGEFSEDGIYVVPETVAELPPVGGILTTGAGNPLSHVQLLARNFGIPNVAVDASVLPALEDRDGSEIVLAVSPAGLVELDVDSDRWDRVFGEHERQEAQTGVTIVPDLEKLDLDFNELISLDELRAEDSGRIVGPQAAKLGELRNRFPEAVAPGFAVPFGEFRVTVLEQPYGNSGETVFRWMVEQYRRMESMPVGSTQRDTFAEQFREELHQLILNAEPGEAFRSELSNALEREFGTGFEGGVFIRSDTNVEDLPGFTGAGLNLTVANVVGFEEVVDAIVRVWASPFTARAFAWRQQHMDGPEHVYPAVLVLRTVPSDVSGVMVTEDVETGDMSTISLAVNEGVGGAVEGQASEYLRVNVADGSVRVMATATATKRMVPVPTGGVTHLPASGADTLLQPAEIEQLIDFSRQIPERFPPIVDEQGNRAPADVEFGFVDGALWLFQIRPFNESRTARGSRYLIQMDTTLAASGELTVDLSEALR